MSFFYVFAVLKGMYLKKRGAIGVPANLLLGYLSATINLLFTMPVEVCNTRQMTGFSEGGILAIVYELVMPIGNPAAADFCARPRVVLSFLSPRRTGQQFLVLT